MFGRHTGHAQSQIPLIVFCFIFLDYLYWLQTVRYFLCFQDFAILQAGPQQGRTNIKRSSCNSLMTDVLVRASRSQSDIGKLNGTK